MKRKINRIIRHFKVHKFKYLNKFLYKVLIVVSVIVFVAIFKMINIASTSMVLEKIHHSISSDFNINEQGKKALRIGEEIIYNSSEFITTFNDKTIDKLSSPIDGQIYRKFKSGTNDGIDILSLDEKDPLSITRGIVREVNINGNKGYFVNVESDNVIITYGYLSKAYVSQGDIIEILDPIGVLGKNKDGKKYLRLEIKMENKIVDPEKYIEISNSLST